MNYRPEGLLIIGYGNPLRADDGAGAAAASRLRVLGFHTLELHQLTPESAGDVAAARTVIFIDADTGVEPGEVRVSEVAAAESGVLEHHATPAGILRLARDVFGSTPRAFFVGLGGEDYGYGDRLSGAAWRAVAKAVEFVCVSCECE